MARLRPLVGEGMEAVRVHDDAAADERARAHRADAVTIGTDVYFRSGRWQPGDPKAFALLAHEATHVAERLRPGASWRRSTGAGAAEEERLALTREAYALSPSPGPPPLAPEAHTALSPPVGTTGAASPANRPMTAASDRVVGLPAGAAIDFEALRAALVRDLIGQLRDEFERGG